jgi:hypothetical protein
VAGLEHADVRLHEGRVLGEALLDGIERGVEGPRVDPGHQPQREEVLAAVLLLRVQRQVFQGGLGEPGDVDLVQAVLRGEIGILQRILAIAGLGEVALFEGGGVHDQDPAGLEIGQVHLQGRRVHGH